MEPQRKDFYGIDLLKYVMALAVVAIHIMAQNKIVYPPAVVWFIRLAVPFFFIISGFFIGSKLSRLESAEARRTFLLKRSVHLFKIFILWLIIYLPWSIYYYMYDYEEHSIISFAIVYIKRIVYYGESYYAWPLWYIYSYAFVCLLMGLTMKWRLRIPLLATLFIVAYIAVYLYDNQISLGMEKIITNTRLLLGRTLGGGLYMLMGAGLYQLYCRGAKLGRYILPALALSIILFYFTLPFGELLGGLAFVIIGLFISLQPSSLWLELRWQSMWMYYTHMYVIMIVYVIYPTMMPVAIIAAVYAGSILLSYCLNRLQNTPGFNKLGLLIK
ncbi:MAG: acyltransferase family protein [Muribaculaceae bacterium]|nr:acyltransferase family protein [Muribaculaceae bacterium]